MLKQKYVVSTNINTEKKYFNRWGCEGVCNRYTKVIPQTNCS